MANTLSKTMNGLQDKPFLAGTALGILLVLGLRAALEGRSAETPRQAGGAGASPISQPLMDLSSVRKENQELQARVREAEQEADFLETTLARRQAASDTPPDNSRAPGSPSELEGLIAFYVGQFQGRVPLSADQLWEEFSALLYDKAAPEELWRYVAKATALLRLQKGSLKDLGELTSILYNYQGSRRLLEDSRFAREFFSAVEDWAKMAPESGKPSLWLGLIAAKHGDEVLPSGGAVLWLREALRRDPGEWKALESLTWLFEKQGDREKAFQFGEEAIRLYHAEGFQGKEPAQMSMLALKLGDLADEENDPARARRYYEEAIQAAEGSPDYLGWPRNWAETKLGVLSLKAGSVPDAILHLRNAGNVSADYMIEGSGMRLELAEALIQKGVFEETKQYLERCLALTGPTSIGHKKAQGLLSRIPK